MRRRTPALAAVAALIASTLPLSPAAAAETSSAAVAPSTTVVISQVYGGGGNGGATFTHDFVELANVSTVPQSLDGLSIMSGSATGTGAIGNSANQRVELIGTIAPGSYRLIELATGGSVGGALPAPDQAAPASNAINLAGASGKVALVTGATSLGCNGGSIVCDDEALARIIDLVGYGEANFFEGTGPAPTLSSTLAAFRAEDGCLDTDDNAADFTAATPAPRNSSAPPNCDPTAPQPVVAACTALSTYVGDAASVQLTASDRDGTVVDAAITAGATPGIALADTTPATTVGGTLFTTLTAADSLEIGAYPVSVTFSNDDDPSQTATCTVTVTVEADPCDAPTLIQDINTVGGNGLPGRNFTGQVLAVEGVVTADFKDGLNGFYVQEEDADAVDAATSTGIFAFTPALPSAPPVGDVVCVTGTVAVFQGATQLTNVTVTPVAEDQALPTAVDLELPVDDRAELALYAGMRVELTSAEGEFTVAQNFFQGQFGELDLSATGRQWNPTELFAPTAPEAAALRAENLRAQIKLDDANSTQNRAPIPWLANGAARAGATTDATIEGVVGHQFGAWRIQPTNAAEIQFTNEGNPRPEGAPDVLDGASGDEAVTVAAFNVLNYFTTLTSQSSAARGADTIEEFELQAAKIVTAITEMNADVVALIEIENNFGASNDALEDLVTRLNAEAGDGTYAAIDLDRRVGTDAISNAMIYQPDAVTAVGEVGLAEQDAFVNPLNANTPRNRPAVAQAFTAGDSDPFVVVANHFKSKGSACGEPNEGGLTGSCNLTRTATAEELVRWLDEDDPTGTGSDDVIVTGDLNSYAAEAPIDVLREAGYVDAFEDQLGETYSYVFDSELGRLDHSFVSAPLAERVTGAAAWHINADEPNGFDYNDWNDPATQDESEFRSSDHDPMIIGLDLSDEVANTPPVVEDQTFSAQDAVPFEGQVVATDADEDDVLTFSFGDTTAGGTVVGAADGSFTYTAPSPAPATDTFPVTVTDAAGASDTATITIRINRAPVLADQEFTVTAGGQLNARVVASDPDGNPLTFAFGEVSTGTLIGDRSGAFSFVPAAGFAGEATFEVTAADNQGGVSRTATVTITVTEAPNQAPTVADLTIRTDEGTPVDGQLVLTDPDGDQLSVEYGTPTSGAVTGADDGSFTYTPADGFTGTATFAVTVTDGRGGSDTATVTVTVDPVDGPGPGPGPGPDDEYLGCEANAGSRFADVPADSVHADAIGCGDELALLEGKTDGRFDPAGSLTRGQAASIIDRIATATGRSIDGDRSTFSDVDRTYVHADAIERLAGAGVITGFTDGTFRPQDEVTRDQLASLLVRYIEDATGATLPTGPQFADVPADSVHATALAKARAAGIVLGGRDGTADPRSDIRRDQAASLFVRSLAVLPVAD